MSQDEYFDARQTLRSQPQPPKIPKKSEMQRYDYLLKLIVIGDPAVGKTNLTLNYCDFDFSESYLATIGIDFKLKTVEVGGKRVKLQIWDTAGQERFQSISKTYYRGAHGVLFVYDLTDIRSFEHIRNWMESYQDASGESPTNTDVTRVLVANKCDMLEERKVPRTIGEAAAISYGVKYFETSARTGHNVERVFTYIAEDIMTRMNLEGKDSPPVTIKAKLKQKQRKDKDKRKKGFWFASCNLL